MSDELQEKLREIGLDLAAADEPEIGSCEADARDAERYRALAAAVGDERIWVYENGFTLDGQVVGSLGLEALAEKLLAEQQLDTLRQQRPSYRGPREHAPDDIR